MVTSVPKLVTFTNKNLKISPRKLRLLATSIKPLVPGEVLTRLRFTNTKAARVLIKAVKNVIADAQNNFHLSPQSLKFVSIQVDEGPKIKRMDKSHGARFARGLIQKRHSRLTIILSGSSDTIQGQKEATKTATPKVTKVKKTK